MSNLAILFTLVYLIIGIETAASSDHFLRFDKISVEEIFGSHNAVNISYDRLKVLIGDDFQTEAPENHDFTFLKEAVSTPDGKYSLDAIKVDIYYERTFNHCDNLPSNKGTIVFLINPLKDACSMRSFTIYEDRGITSHCCSSLGLKSSFITLNNLNVSQFIIPGWTGELLVDESYEEETNLIDYFCIRVDRNDLAIMRAEEELYFNTIKTFYEEGNFALPNDFHFDSNTLYADDLLPLIPLSKIIPSQKLKFSSEDSKYYYFLGWLNKNPKVDDYKLLAISILDLKNEDAIIDIVWISNDFPDQIPQVKIVCSAATFNSDLEVEYCSFFLNKRRNIVIHR